MNLYIRIKDGNPVDHPIMEDNFVQAFPDIDVNNLPSEFVKFERIERPFAKPYTVYVGVTYQWVDGVVKDVHQFRPMTEEERAETDARQAIKIARWLEESNTSSIGEARV